MKLVSLIFLASALTCLMGQIKPPPSPVICSGSPLNCSFPSGSTVTVGTSVSLSVPTGSDDRSRIQAAIDAASTAGGTVQLPSGTYHITSALMLRSGVSLIGETPKTAYVGSNPDFTFTPSGGTWIDCGAGVNCMTGSLLRSVTLQGVGFLNFTGQAVLIGGNNVNGISMSMFRDLVAVGGATVNSSDEAFKLYNFQHLEMHNCQAFHINIGFHGIQQSSTAQGLNSTWDDLYVYTYTKSAANGNASKPGIWVQALDVGGGGGLPAGAVTFHRPQVNSYSGDGTGYHVRIEGTATTSLSGINMYDMDLEGTQAASVYANYTYHSFFLPVVGDPTVANYFYFDSNTYNLVGVGAGGSISVHDGGANNTFYGSIKGDNTNTSPFTPLKGAWGNSATNKATVNADLISSSGPVTGSQFTFPAGCLFKVASGLYPGFWCGTTSIAAPDFTNYNFLYDPGAKNTALGAPATGKVSLKIANTPALEASAAGTVLSTGLYAINSTFAAPPGVSGCSAAIVAGSNTLAGSITTGTTGTCTIVWTMQVQTYPHGPVCTINNMTTGNLMRQTAYTTATATFTGTTVSGDVLVYNCIGW